jgi:hypothetical protein
MDIDQIVKHVPELLRFKAAMELLVPPHVMAQAKEAVDDPVKAEQARQMLEDHINEPVKTSHSISVDAHDLDALSDAMSEVMELKPEFEKAIADMAKLREELAPVIAWVQAQQKAAAEVTTDKVEEPKAPDPDKPLEHLAEVEASLEAAPESPVEAVSN